MRSLVAERVCGAFNIPCGLFELFDLLRLAEVDVPLDDRELCYPHVLHERLRGQLRRIDRAEDVPAHLMGRHLPDLFVREDQLWSVLGLSPLIEPRQAQGPDRLVEAPGRLAPREAPGGHEEILRRDA